MNKPPFDPSKPFASVDDKSAKPPFDPSQPFQEAGEEDEGKTLTGFTENALDNAGRLINPLNMAAGLASTMKQGLYDIPKAAGQSSIGLLQGLAKAITGGGLPTAQDVSNSPIIAQTRNMTEPIAKDPVGFAYKNPIDAASLIAAPVMGLMGGGEVAGTTPAAESFADTVGQRLSAKAASQAFDINPRALGSLAAKAGLTPEEEVIQLTNRANELVPDLIKPLSTANTKVSTLLKAHDQAGQTIGDIAKSVSEKTSGALPEAQQTIDSLNQAAKDYYGVDGGESALQKTADRLDALRKDGKLDFDRLSKVKSAIGEGFGKKNVPPGTEETYNILNHGTNSVIDRLSSENPNLLPQITNAREVYTITSRLLPAMSRAATREVAGSSMGGGVLGKAIPAGLGAAVGGMPGALIGAGAKYLQEAVAPDLLQNLVYLAKNKSGPIGSIVKGSAEAVKPAIAANAASQASINDMIRKLVEKYAERRKF